MYKNLTTHSMYIPQHFKLHSNYFSHFIDRLRLEEVKYFAQGCTTRKYHSWNSISSPVSNSSPIWTLWFSQSNLLKMKLKGKIYVKYLVGRK